MGDGDRRRGARLLRRDRRLGHPSPDAEVHRFTLDAASPRCSRSRPATPTARCRCCPGTQAHVPLRRHARRVARRRRALSRRGTGTRGTWRSGERRDLDPDPDARRRRHARARRSSGSTGSWRRPAPPAEVIVVDAGSRDGTLELAAELADRFPLLHMRILVQDRDRTRLRLRRAARDGLRPGPLLRRSSCPTRATRSTCCRRCSSELREGAHLVLCSRYEERARRRERAARASASTSRSTGARSGSLLGYDIPDSTYGFRAFHRTFVQALGLSAHSLAVCPEITFKVLLAGGKVVACRARRPGRWCARSRSSRLRNELAATPRRCRARPAPRRPALVLGVSRRASRAAGRPSSPRTGARSRGSRRGSSTPRRTRSRARRRLNSSG